MSTVPVSAHPAGDPDGEVGLVQFLLALQQRVAQLNRQLDRVETEMHRVLSEASRDRFEDYR